MTNYTREMELIYLQTKTNQKKQKILMTQESFDNDPTINIDIK